MRIQRAALLVYGLLNAALYAGLLPLWEGWDEPFHYGCVQKIAHGHLPVLGQTALSREIWNSLDLVPEAEGVRKNIRKGVTFGEYFRLAPAIRADLRRRLESLDPRTASDPSEAPNYEAQQPPLAYVLLVPLDRLWSTASLPDRILCLRLVCGFAAVLLTAWGTLRLATLLGAPPDFADAALFLVFSTQMFYAATAHITNDWLAVPLFPLLLAQAVTLYRMPRFPSALWLGAVLGIALLVKAYFLPAALLAWGLVAILVRRRKLPVRHAAGAAAVCIAIAAPWYVGNLLRGNLSGMQETAGGAPVGELVHAALRLPWLATLWNTAHSALWTGNNTYLAFSGLTLNLMLLLLGVATGVYFWQYRRAGSPPGERIVLVGMLMQVVGLTYATVVFFWASHGAASTPSPWYWQALWPAAAGLLMLGVSRAGRRGRWIGIAIVGLWTYVIVATYIAKLIPLYAGLSDGRTRLADLPRWYGGLISGSAGTLATTALMQPAAILALALLVGLAASAMAARICYRVGTRGN